MKELDEMGFRLERVQDSFAAATVTHPEPPRAI